MKKLLTTLLCLAMSCTLFACGFPSTASTTSSAPVADSIKSETVEQKSETEEAKNDAKNADTDLTGYAFQGYIELGSYPQTKADHRAVAQMSEVVDETGYYFSTYDNEHYAKISKAKVYGYRYKTADDLFIEEDSTYYFKVEPIKWQVFLSVPTDGQPRLYLISDTILNCHAFTDNSNYIYNAETDSYTLRSNDSVLANSWAYSDLRSWLNETFYNAAFSTKDKSLLVSRETSSITKIYKADDNTEYVWVPSASEAQLLISHTALLSDYARCNNTFMCIYPKFYGNGRYWTTTAGSKTYSAAFVYDNTTSKVGLSGESVGSAFIGVRPVISVMMSDAITILQETEEE